jgi:hypothetical protein
VRFIVGYGRLQIVREREGAPFRIYYRDSEQLASPLEFWRFSDARAECDDMSQGG